MVLPGLPVLSGIVDPAAGADRPRKNNEKTNGFEMEAVSE